MSPGLLEAAIVAAFAGMGVAAAIATIRIGRSQRQARLERERREAAIEGAGISLWDWTPADDALWLDANWSAMIGGAAAELRSTATRIAELVHDDDRERLRESVAATLSGREPRFDVEIRVRAVGGGWRWMRVRGSVIERDAGGRALRVGGTNADITARKRAERALAENEARFRSLSELSSDLHFEMDAAFHLVTWSAPAWARGADTGLPRPALEAPELTGADWEPHRAVLEARRAFRDLEIRQVSDDGRESWLSVGAVPILDERGAFAGYRGLARIITDRKAAERDLREREAQFRQLVEFMPAAIVLVDRDERVVVHNRAYAETLGLPPARIAGARVADILGPRFVDVAPHLRQALAGATTRYETRRLLPDGRLADFDVLHWPLRDAGGDVRGVIVLGIDVTRLREADRMKDHFVSVVSHELRTPLTAMRGSLGLLAGGIAGELPAEAKPLADMALQNSDRLWRLVNDLLDIGKMAAGEVPFRLADVAWPPLLAEAVESARGLAREFDVTFRLDCPADLVVRGDVDRLLQVLSNLLLNAAKFSPAGGEVTVGAHRTREGAVRTAVRDRGPGVPEAFRSRIFAPFAQAETGDTRRHAGTGLGLAISREIVEHLGGRIGFGDAAGGGTEFWFELPAAEIENPVNPGASGLPAP